MNDSVLADIGPTKEKTIACAKDRLLCCAEAGFFKNAIPVKFQGKGNTYAELVKAHETLGYQTRDPGLMLAINAHIWGALFTLVRFGTNAQKNTWIPLLLDGQIISGHAISEPHAGSNVSAMTSQFESKDDGFILNGHKRYITNTPIAGMMIVYAKQLNSNKLSAFIVKATDPGAEFKSAPGVNGCDTATMGDILLSDCSIPGSRLVGKSGAGSTMIQLALELERAFIFSGITGVMQWQLEKVISYVRKRGTGTDSLAQHQAVSHKVAMMKLRLDTSRLWIKHCAQLMDAGKRITSPSAQTKLYASDAFLKSSLDAVHILGASGLNDELTSLVNDAMAGRLMSGSSEIQKNIIAAMLGIAAKKNA